MDVVLQWKNLEDQSKSGIGPNATPCSGWKVREILPVLSGDRSDEDRSGNDHFSPSFVLQKHIHDRAGVSIIRSLIKEAT